MPTDCHLGELLQQLNSLNVAKPSERTLIRQGKKLPEWAPGALLGRGRGKAPA